MYGKYRNPQYPLRVPKDVLDKIKYIAGYHCRTVNREIESVLKKYIEDFEDAHGDIPTPEN